MPLLKNQSRLISSVGESPSGLNPSVLVSIAVLPSVEFTAMTILDYNSFVEFEVEKQLFKVYITKKLCFLQASYRLENVFEC